MDYATELRKRTNMGVNLDDLTTGAIGVWVARRSPSLTPLDTVKRCLATGAGAV